MDACYKENGLACSQHVRTSSNGDVMDVLTLPVAISDVYARKWLNKRDVPIFMIFKLVLMSTIQRSWNALLHRPMLTTIMYSVFNYSLIDTIIYDFRVVGIVNKFNLSRYGEGNPSEKNHYVLTSKSDILTNSFYTHLFTWLT